MDFAVLADHWVKLKENEKKDKYLDLARGLKNLWNMKVMVIPIVIRALGTVIKNLVKGPEDLEIRGQVEIIQNYSITEIGQNTEKSQRDLSLTLQWKTIH